MATPFDALVSSSLGQLLLIIVFIVFIFVVRRVVRVIITGVWVGIISLLFPIFLNKIVGLPVALNLETFLYFAKLGLGLYGIYLFARLVYSILGAAEKAGSLMVSPISHHRKKKKEEMEKKMEKFIKDREEDKKKKEKRGKKLEKEKKKKKKKKPSFFFKREEE